MASPRDDEERAGEDPAKTARSAGEDPVEAPGAAGDAPAGEESTFWEDFRDYYLTFDRRTLGIARIFIGFYLVFDLLRRTPDWWKMFSNDGVLPTHYNLWRPQGSGWTFLNGFAERGELWLLWVVILGVFLCYLVGYKTKVMQVLAAILVASMNGRVLLIENGGYVVQNLLLLWTAFLPMGDRFSLDALRAALRTQTERGPIDLNDRRKDVAHWRLEPFVSVVGAVILLQLSAIYFFNVVHKYGVNWKNFHAVHYVLYVDRMVTPLFASVREYVPGFVEKILTASVLGAEAGMAVVLWSPLARVWARRLTIIFINFLHIGFGSTFVLGPFAWALCCFSILLISREDWELVERTMRRVHRARTVRYEAGSAWAFFWCRLLKRADGFCLLTFEADPRAKGLEVTTPDGARKAGVEAAADILSALPGGPILGAPIRLPLFKQLAALVGLGLGALGRFLGMDRQPAVADRASGYQPELKDDPGRPVVDGYFMIDWLKRYFDGRFLGLRQLHVAGAVTLLGGFGFIYASEMLRRKLEVKVNEELVAGYTVEEVCFWGGIAVCAVGLFFLLRPFAVMNATTPSTMTRKWTRVSATVREGLALLFFVGAVNQALVELWVARPLALPQPEIPRMLAHKMRYLQGWFMFSPNPVMVDGILVVDAITVDGRRVDPFTTDTYDHRLEPPRYDLLEAKSYKYNQIWSDYFNRMGMSQNTAFRKPMQEYMFRLPERTGNPDDAIVKGTVYWLEDNNPRWGTTKSYGLTRKELFKFVNPDPEVQKRYRELTGGEDPPELPVPGEAAPIDQG